MDISRRLLLAAGMGLTVAAPRPAAAASSLVPVTDLGVVPDTERDQSAAIQTAIDRAARKGFGLMLPAGHYVAAGLRVSKSLHLEGLAGRSLLVSPDGEAILVADGARSLSPNGLAFDGRGRSKSGPPRSSL